MTSTPRIARVQILWSENSAVRPATYRSLADADAALAAAFAMRPPSWSGVYNKTEFEVVWTDGRRFAGSTDVRDVEVRTAPGAGGILRQHLATVARWYRDKSATAVSSTPEEKVEQAAWGVELLRRLDAEPALEVPRNLDHIAEHQRFPIGATSDQFAVSLLPDPAAAVAELEAHFANIRPPVPVWMGHSRTVPRTTNEDVTYAANWLSLALAHDMPRLREQAGRPHGAIWDCWAKTVEHVRRHLDAEPDATYRDNQRFWSDQAPYLAHKIRVALHGGDAPRNAAAAERLQWKIRYRGPRGGEYVTHHLAPDYFTALEVAARSLGFWPAVQGVAWLDGDRWRAA
jgi:hypothetical protein